MSKSKTIQPPATPVVIDESSVAWKLFNAFVNDPKITVTEDELRSYAIDELKLPQENMSPELKENLPVIVVAFMNMWSGWHFKNDYLAGKFEKEHYFERFQKFMMHKMNITVKGQFNNAMKALGEQIRLLPDVGSSNKTEQEFSPYSILIHCPPHMLNTIVFSNSGDDVIMKQHLGSSWQDLTTFQLLNWPYVEVMFRTQDVCFVRRQATEFVRYLNFLPHESHRYNENILEHVENLPSYGSNRACYAYNFLEKYLRTYLHTLHNLPQVQPRKYDEISAIITTFLEDVRYIDVNSSMATNTVVLFRLSKVPFIRNKKLVKNSDKESDEPRVGYCEIITPKVELVLMYFKPVQIEDSDHLAFVYTDKLKSAPADALIMPYISYKCGFCREEFTTSDAQSALMNHLKLNHKMEQHVRCTMCKKQFDVVNLAACRWRHKCLPCATSPKK